jgi:hypothetical protein
MAGVKGQPTPGNPNIKNYGFGARPREVDDEYRSRIKGVPRRIIWTKDYCIGQLNDLLDILKKVLKDSDKLETNNPKKLKDETIRDTITLTNKIMDFMRYLYPPVQQSVNINIDTTADMVVERLKNWKQRQHLVVGGNEDGDTNTTNEKFEDREDEGEVEDIGERRDG